MAAREQVEMLDAVRARDLERATALGRVLQPLCDAIFASPVRDYRARLKHALSTLGVIDEAHVRPPLLPLSPEGCASVEKALEEAALR